MNELALFAGIGGGILGGLLCGHRTVCAVEIEPYCQAVLVQRQNDGHLPPFPIWDDIRTFDGRPWLGIVDVVSGGFPCQNISTAGDRTGITGEKSSLWFEMLRVIRQVRPQYVFVENSAGLVWNGLDVVLGGLSEVGYDAEWLVLGADDVGANHLRKRCWILGNIPNTEGNAKHRLQKTYQPWRLRKNVPDTGKHRLEQWIGQFPEVNEDKRGGTVDTGRVPVNAFGKWWQVEPRIRRVVDGCSHRLDRLKGLGNAQVPLCAATAWQILYQRINV